MTTSGEEVNITAGVKNTGTARGNELVSLSVDGTLENSKMITLSSGEAKTVEFKVSRKEEGIHNVELGGMSSSITIKPSRTEVLEYYTDMAVGGVPLANWKRNNMYITDILGATDIVGNPSSVEGKFGKAISFGSDDCVKSNYVVNFGSGFTFSARIKRSREDSMTEAIMAKTSPKGWVRGGEIIGVGKGWRMREGNRLFTEVWGEVAGHGKTYIEAGKWYHVAVTWDGEVRKFYVNGKLDGSSSVPITEDLPGHVVFIGGMPGWYPFVDAIDEVKIYDKALSENQIERIYENNAQIEGCLLEMSMDEETFTESFVGEKVRPGEHIKGTLSVRARNFIVVPSLVSSPYYRDSLKPNHSKKTPSTWTFDIWPTEKATGKKIKVRFNLYAQSLWKVTEPGPIVQKTLPMCVKS